MRWLLACLGAMALITAIGWVFFAAEAWLGTGAVLVVLAWIGWAGSRDDRERWRRQRD